jgi:hypothetical protein
LARNEQAEDPDLAAVAQAWPNLPPPIRAAVLALVKATASESSGGGEGRGCGQAVGSARPDVGSVKRGR